MERRLVVVPYNWGSLDVDGSVGTVNCFGLSEPFSEVSGIVLEYISLEVEEMTSR